jgi:hypothetical protein
MAHHEIPFSPPETASSQHESERARTHKSHRLRTSPVVGEGSTYIPVVKFSQSFTQRNALRGTKPVYATADVEQPQEADIVSVAQARTHGWTISITSSSHTDEDLQVEVQQHFEPPGTVQQQRQRERERPIPQMQPPPSRIQKPRLPVTIVPPVPTLSYDRVVITEEDISRLRVKCIAVLVLGFLLPPLWLLMGWGHSLDGIFLPSGWQTSQREICDVYKSYRRIASVLSGVAVLGTLAGVVLGGLALGGII